VRPRDAAQLLIDDRNQPGERVIVAAAPVGQKLGDVQIVGGCRHCASTAYYGSARIPGIHP